MLRQLRLIVRIQPQHQAEAAAQRRADQALPRGRADRREALDVHRHRARAGTRADQDVHAKIFERRINHLLDVRLQAVNFVDEENFALLNVAQDAHQVELLLQHRTRGLLNADAQLRRDDAGQRRLAQARRPVEQHVIHRFAALLRGFDGDREIFLDLRLSREIGEPARAQRGFKLPLLFAQRRRNNALFAHEVLVY